MTKFHFCIFSKETLKILGVLEVITNRITCEVMFTNHVLTRGMSTALRVRPDLMSKGRGAHIRAIPGEMNV